jgi:hypothetical protein
MPNTEEAASPQFVLAAAAFRCKRNGPVCAAWSMTRSAEDEPSRHDAVRGIFCNIYR